MTGNDKLGVLRNDRQPKFIQEVERANHRVVPDFLQKHDFDVIRLLLADALTGTVGFDGTIESEMSSTISAPSAVRATGGAVSTAAASTVAVSTAATGGCSVATGVAR